MNFFVYLFVLILFSKSVINKLLNFESNSSYQNVPKRNTDVVLFYIYLEVHTCNSYNTSMMTNHNALRKPSLVVKFCLVLMGILTGIGHLQWLKEPIINRVMFKIRL